ncbi:hypothetical protein [Quadrisphaera setariae]|uniref:Uncharacterized protein n=1 Tax=Quadrisphaera setariae TaxID=2593304 RepID=A0A5C8ZBZ8_9ACTN|nr:hypothetical protein [Quadrisphaera setariae]TXR55635.1 hypothetical protein FMM08_12365 [Quadrisphaera setariae]
MTRSDRPLRTPRVPRLRRASGEVVPDAAPPQTPQPPRLAPAPGRAKTPAARGAHALEVVQQPMPGHLYLDPDVPADEVIDLTCGPWTGRASHVWTGVGWARLVPGPIAVVPTSRPKVG